MQILVYILENEKQEHINKIHQQIVKIVLKVFSEFKEAVIQQEYVSQDIIVH